MVPTVTSVHTLKQLLDKASQYDICLFAYEETAKQGDLAQLKQTLSTIENYKKLLVIVGPEGGISEKEETILLESGFKPCAL